MFSSSRFQAFAAVVLGAFAALSPLWLDTNNAARTSLIVLGVLIAVAGAVQLARADMAMADYAIAVFGVLLFIAPWAMKYHEFNGASWTSWVVGVLAAVMAVAALPAFTARMHHDVATHH